MRLLPQQYLLDLPRFSLFIFKFIDITRYGFGVGRKAEDPRNSDGGSAALVLVGWGEVVPDADDLVGIDGKIEIAEPLAGYWAVVECRGRDRPLPTLGAES